MTLRNFAFCLTCVVVLFPLGCSRESEPAQAESNTFQEADRAILDYSPAQSGADSTVADEGEPSSAEQTEESDKQRVVSTKQKAKDWKSEDRPWTSEGVFGVNRPLDFERLASGIRQKYELEALDDPRLELEALLRLFESGDSSVVFDLGLFLAYGDDLINDPVRAVEFFEEAAINGEARALAELGRLYLVGQGVPKDAALAESYFRQAMDEGDSEGAFLLGAGNRLELFENSDTEMGMAYLETAAQFGHDAAAIALLYVALDLDQYAEQANGEEAEAWRLAREQIARYRDMEMWLLGASETGDVESINALARYYSAIEEREKTASAYETAAELGSFLALNQLIELRAQELRNPKFRDSMKELMAIHLENGGLNKERANFMMALLESFTASDPKSKARVRELLENETGRQHDQSIVALSAIESGEPELDAIIRAHLLKEEEAYLRRIQIRSKSKTGDGEYGSPVAPRLVKTVAVAYPAELEAEAITGEVLVEFLVDREGRVFRAEAVESTHPAFSKSAVEAISNYEFSATPGEDYEAIRFSIRLFFNSSD